MTTPKCPECGLRYRGLAGAFDENNADHVAKRERHEAGYAHNTRKATLLKQSK